MKKKKHVPGCPAGDPDQNGDREIWPCTCGFERSVPAPQAAEPTSCGNSCVIARPKGMATNGPCHCLDGLSPSDRVRIRAAFVFYRERIKQLEHQQASTTPRIVKRAFVDLAGGDDDECDTG